ncbi:MAG: hypothetical protein A2Y17_09380 [Clostridiales bacterium GWF2_38_85]|nr:MAG: hypothetical protein A2Y17_09380 [Clostridiales bacterium GWF2_38_85]
MSSKDYVGKINESEISVFKLKSGRLEAKILNYGAIIQSLKLDGRDIVFGFDTLDGYIKTNDYYGAIAGRYANRIADGRFMLGDQKIILDKNENGISHLHGGFKGFDKAVWNTFSSEHYISLTKSFKDGNQGYPGNIDVSITYSLQYNRMVIIIDADSDADTVFNPTSHSYFNLSGANGENDILAHKLTLYADKYNEIDENKIPVGEAIPVEDTPFDFRKAIKIGERINEDNIQLEYGNGYDHNYWINKDNKNSIKIQNKTCYRAATVEYGNITMDVFSSQPCIQFYSGNFMNKPYPFNGGITQRPRYGFCLEPQVCPNSPNLPGCGDALLKKNEKYRYVEVIEFR